MIFRAAVRLRGYLGEEREQGLEPAESPSGVHAAAAVTGATARAGEKAGDLSDRVFNQMAAEVLNKIGAFELESVLKGIIKVTDSYLEFRFQLFPVISTAGGSVLVGRLPRDLDIELLDSDSTSLPNFAKLLLVQKICVVEKTGIAFNFCAVPGIGFQLQDFLGKALVIFKDGESLKRKLCWHGFGALDFPSEDVNLGVFLRVISGKLNREIGLHGGRELDFFLSSGFILQFGQMGNIGGVIRDDFDLP